MPSLFRCFFLLLLPWVAGCHNPARQNVPEVQIEVREAEWRKELIPGRRADRALAYLLTQGFDCQMSRDDKGRLIRIEGTPRAVLRDASGMGRHWRVDLAIEDDLVQSVKIENGR